MYAGRTRENLSDCRACLRGYCPNRRVGLASGPRAVAMMRGGRGSLARAHFSPAKAASKGVRCGQCGRVCRVFDYLFVTIGGGGVVQPAIVARASTAMIARAAFFIFESSVPWMYRPLMHRSCGAPVPKRHCGCHSIEQPPLAVLLERGSKRRPPLSRVIKTGERLRILFPRKRPGCRCDLSPLASNRARRRH